MHRNITTCEQLQRAHIYMALMHARLCPCVCVCVAWQMCTAGWPGRTYLSVSGTSLAFLSPQGPQLCPEAGRLEGGTS